MLSESFILDKAMWKFMLKKQNIEGTTAGKDETLKPALGAD